MANEEHLRILRQGVGTWNQWRKEHPVIRPDLIGARLSGANLEHVDLSRARLNGANLRDADLTRADLGGVSLSGGYLERADLRGANLGGAEFTAADLSGANLSRVNLSGTNLYDVDLTGADLSGVALIDAVFRGADFREADFSGAIVLRTVFDGVHLSEARGLESVIHRGPSTIGINTAYAYQGQIPEVFLRGAGVPDELITYMRSFVGQAIEFYSCFISYSSKDHEFAERLHADLQTKGVQCWFAPEDMKIGDKISDRLEQSIRRHDKLLLVLSANSIGSEWVEDEVTTAFEEERRRGKTVLFPVRVDDTVFDTKEPWAAKMRQRHAGDFRQWKQHDAYRKAFDRLLRDLRASQETAPAALLAR